MNPFLEWLFGMKRKEIQIVWRIGPVGQKTSSFQQVYRHKKREDALMSLIMTVTQECPLEVKFKDSQGNEAPVENIQWSSSDPNIIIVHANDAVPTKAIVLAAGVAGTGQVNVKADPKIGEPVGEIVGLLDVEIIAAEATVVEISAGTPIETPHVEPIKRRK
ncbi:MAG: hypothetical protein ABWY78_06310 [Microvirga sp.]